MLYNRCETDILTFIGGLYYLLNIFKQACRVCFLLQHNQFQITPFQLSQQERYRDVGMSHLYRGRSLQRKWMTVYCHNALRLLKHYHAALQRCEAGKARVSA